MFLDTSIILEMFQQDSDEKRALEIQDKLGTEPLYISMVQLAEISDWCLSNGVDARGVISEIKDFVNIVLLDEEICHEGAKIKHEMRRSGARKFALNDGIILASARLVGEKLLTRDRDFSGAEDTIVLS
jgi:predicted nucleic acid-binding protein